MTDSDPRRPATRSAATRKDRERLEELRERRRESSVDAMNNARTTVIINLSLSLLSGILFAVGLFYVFRFLAWRRPSMDQTTFRIFFYAFGAVSIGWFGWLVVRILLHIRRLRELGGK